MEKIMSVEDKIRRAEEIYARRRGENIRPTTTLKVDDSKKDIKLLKKMILQIITCLCIYLIFYAINNNNYIFSQDFINKAQEILSYNINFTEIYENVKNWVMNWNIKDEQRNLEESAIGGAEENTVIEQQDEQINEDTNSINEQSSEQQQNEQSENIVQETQTSEQSSEINNEVQVSEQPEENNVELSQTEIDIQTLKNTTTLIKPVEGTVSSKYGQRTPTTPTVPKNHTGTDIAANTGTKIKSATNGEVVLVSSEGDFGNHVKIQIGEVSIIYAHCNAIYVKQGDVVTQGQEIAEVGSTGNSTGPHLHFEIRVSERTIDPQNVIEL